MVRISAASKKNGADSKPNSSNFEGLVSDEDLNRAYSKRNQKYVNKNLVKQDITSFLAEGWEKVRSRSKNNVKLRKLKDIGPGFEDDVWCIFYRMGFFEMNKDSKFVIPRFESDITKQIDIFAREDQCICIVECKAAEVPHSKKSLDKDIDQLAAIRRDIDLSINRYYEEKGLPQKFKFVWILATKNIDLNDNDKQRAEKANIFIIDDPLLEYYNEFSKHFGHSAKYQFLSDFLLKREIPNLINSIPAIKGTMGEKEFYSFVIEPEKLLKLAYISHRGKRNIESLDSYQRMAKKKRLNKIAEYIHEKKGIFPTNIVLNIQTDSPLRFDKAADMAGRNAVLGELYLPNVYQCAQVIDGQHRLFAFSNLTEAMTATIPVIAFENLDSATQAQLFIDINGEQVKVPKNQLLDIHSELNWDSDDPNLRLDALLANLVKHLDKDKNSPLRDKVIKIGGNKTKTRNLTLNGLVTELKKDRLFGDILNKKTKEITPGPLYQEDLDSTLIRGLEVISGYYSLFLKNDKVKSQWDAGSGEGGYVCTNLGILTTLKLLKFILDHLAVKDGLEVRKLKTSTLLEHIEKYLSPVITFLANPPPQILSELRRSTGESGVKDSTLVLLSKIHEQFPEFEPDILKDWLRKKDPSINNETRELILDKIEPMIHNYVFSTLKSNFGEDPSQWWFKVNPTIRNEAMKKADDAGEIKDFEKFIDLIHLKKIIDENWSLFGEIFTLYATSNDNKTKRLAWFTKMNGIRNNVSHTIKGKGVSAEELEFVRSIHKELLVRLKSPA
jgi:DNA sulfur modification protein DndB